MTYVLNKCYQTYGSFHKVYGTETTWELYISLPEPLGQDQIVGGINTENQKIRALAARMKTVYHVYVWEEGGRKRGNLDLLWFEECFPVMTWTQTQTIVFIMANYS